MARFLGVVLCLGLVLGGTAAAELQNIDVGGQIRIEGNYIRNWAAQPAPAALRIPSGYLWQRPVGQFAAPVTAFNGPGILSIYSWNDDEDDLAFMEERVRLHVLADFTDHVSGFIEFDSYDFWGEDFRSNYITGVDGRANAGDDVELYQAYIETAEMWGLPIGLRIGRQELSFGAEWLVGPKDFGPSFTGRSFDGIRLRYATDRLEFNAFATKLAESGTAEKDGDVDFYGIYKTYRFCDAFSLDGFWFFLRDARALNDTRSGWVGERVENMLGLDNYETTQFHTIGLRAFGAAQGFDYSLEAAYQFGEAAHVGFGFKPAIYGDDDAEYDAWALQARAGYTFDAPWQPRLHAGYSFYDGEDNRDLSFAEWLNPFHRPEASVSFNRLFSNQMYNGFFDLHNNMSNVHVFRAGINTHPLPLLDMHYDLAYFLADETFDRPRAMDFPLLPFSPLSFWTRESDDELGLVSDLVFVYRYSEDLMFLAHWSHLFSGEGLGDGNFTAWNGLLFDGGSDDDDSDYFRFETQVNF